MTRGFDVAGATSALAAAGVAALVAGLLSVAPAHGAKLAVAGPAGSPAPTDTATGTPTPTPEPTVTPAPGPTPTVPPVPTPTLDPALLAPDVVALRASQPSIQVRGDGRRRLRFTSSLANIGAGPLEVRPNDNQPCADGQRNSTQIVYRDDDGNGRYDPRRDTDAERHRAGCMLYHPYHDHWHFKASARYSLLQPGAEQPVVVSARRKVSFCLRDSDRVPRWSGRLYPLAYGSCTRTRPQGISVGWMDVYQSFLAGQYLALPEGLENGVYCLQTLVDPLNQLTETDDSNNGSILEIVIRGDRVATRDTIRCR